jgi:hypothetical protein
MTFAASQQANAIRAVNSTDSHRAGAAPSSMPLEGPILIMPQAFTISSPARSAAYCGPNYEDMT